MAKLNMQGPFDFTMEQIDKVISKTSPENYALGYVDPSDNKFVVKYVGWSETDLKQELKARINKKYTSFKYSFASSSKAAFDEECRNFHDFGGTDLDNKIHPDRPKDMNWKCLYCNKFS